MGLSNEVPPNTQVIDAYQARLIEMHAHGIAAKLIAGQRNEQPKDSTNNAGDPSKGIRIRRQIDVERSLAASRVPVDEACAAHNARVSGLGNPETFEHLWKGRP